MYDPLPVWKENIEVGFFHTAVNAYTRRIFTIPGGGVLHLSQATLECDFIQLDTDVLPQFIQLWMTSTTINNSHSKVVDCRQILLATFQTDCKHFHQTIDINILPGAAEEQIMFKIKAHFKLVVTF